MIWIAYPVAFRLLSPLHVGWRKLGNLQQTRPYLTGRTIWGALTARLTREQRRSDYGKVGEEVDQQLTFTYFYPSVNSKATEKVTPWPWPDKQWDEFAWTFLGSYASTALTDGHSSEAGSLHETEYIAPVTRDEKAVYMVGYIFERDDCNLPWKRVLNKLQFGGERGYGWGRVSLEDPEDLESVPVTNNTCFDYELNCAGDYPVITIPEGKEVLAHIDTEDVKDPNIIEGTIEPLIGRETSSTGGFGATFPKANICWMPGSKVKVKQGVKFQIQEKGIWKQLQS
jgi:hypothetical protein